MYSNENTQSAGSDYDADEYEGDESLITADKRSHSVVCKNLKICQKNENSFNEKFPIATTGWDNRRTLRSLSNSCQKV